MNRLENTYKIMCLHSKYGYNRMTCIGIVVSIWQQVKLINWLSKFISRKLNQMFYIVRILQ